VAETDHGRADARGGGGNPAKNALVGELRARPAAARRYWWHPWLAGALLAIATAHTATAQSYTCDRPYEPDVPDGYSAEYEEMQDAEGEVEDYSRNMREYVNCLQNEHDDAASELSNTADEWSNAVDAFNNR
jgi:hypothetical protein